MVKNTIGGKKAKRAKNQNDNGGKRPILWAEDLQMYGRVERILGDMRCDVLCKDGTQRICKIRGKLKKRVWISTGDIVLICLRDFQDDKADIIHKYNVEEVKILIDQNEFNPDIAVSNKKRSTLDDLLEEPSSSSDEDINTEICFDEI